MNQTTILIAAAVFTFLFGLGLILWRKWRRAQLDKESFLQRWRELQKLLRNKAHWSEAVVEADNMLDEALRMKGVRGRNMGARLVRAQRDFSDNDALWYGHKLRARIDSDPTTKLKEKEVKQALVGIRQGLKDLGALPQ